MEACPCCFAAIGFVLAKWLLELFAASRLGVRDSDDLMIMTAAGQAIRSPVKGIRVIGRATQGVRLMKLGKDESGKSLDRITDVARIVSEENGEPSNAAAPEEGEENNTASSGPNAENAVGDKEE